LLELTDIAITVQNKGRFVDAGALRPKSSQSGIQRFYVFPKAYANPPKRRATNEDAIVWTNTLKVTKDESIERQKETIYRIGLQMSAKTDWAIMIRP
jgi:hypothetical protein